MSPEIPGRPDKHQNIDDKARSRTDSSQSSTEPEVTVDDQKIGKEKTDLDRVNAEMKKYAPDSSAYKALETKRNNLLQNQEPLESGNDNPQTNSTENENNDNENPQTNSTENENTDNENPQTNSTENENTDNENPQTNSTENENTDNETSKDLTDSNGINDDIYADMRKEYGGTGNQSESPSPSEQSYDDLASIYGSDGNGRYGDGNYGEGGYDAGDDTSDTGSNF